MKLNWLKSRTLSIVFLCSTVELFIIVMYALLIAIPVVRQYLNSSSANEFFGDVFAVGVILAIPSMIVISLGMAIFCAGTNDHSVGAKALWFVLFFLTGPIGSMAYYFAVYRRHVMRNRAANLSYGLE